MVGLDTAVVDVALPSVERDLGVGHISLQWVVAYDQLLAGLGFGLCGPTLQIGALSGVPSLDLELAAGLVETMREGGEAAGVVVVTTLLVSGSDLEGSALLSRLSGVSP